MSGKSGKSPAMGSRWADIKPPLSPWILDVIDEMGFERMTPVQSSTIPRGMGNQDCVVEAVTGSGKTLSFVIPILERITRRPEQYKKGQIAAVVIAPTRELAQQIHELFNHFITSLHRSREPSPEASSSRSPSPAPGPAIPPALLLTSGTTKPYETFLTNGSSILVGTPGRLASFLLSPRGQSIVRVSELDVLVMDEADRMLSSPDHRKDIERILGHLPKQRRTHLFSATMTDAVEEMIGLGLRNPVKIVVNLKDKRAGEQATERRLPTTLDNRYLVCRHAEKTLQLERLFRREARQNEAAKFIVYFSTGAAVDYFYRILSKLPSLSNFHLTSLHGDLPPRVRENAMKQFSNHPSSHLSPAVLLCTDVTARGVDFDDIDVVLQYDPPTDPKTFSHRAGRTARAGKRGKAVVLLGKGREQDYVGFLNARKIPLTETSYLDGHLNEITAIPEVDQAAFELRDEIRKIVVSDRELADKGAKAFVSSLQAYRKHEASFIFRLPDLDLGSVATAFGVLRLPAMPEVRNWRKKISSAKKSETQEDKDAIAELVEWQDADVDWNTYAYLSKQRESTRLTALEAKRNDPSIDEAKMEKKRKAKTELREAWSDQKEKKAKKEERRSKKDKRKAAEWEKAQAEGGNVDIGMVEAFKKIKGSQEADKGADLEYKAMKKELKEEKQAKRSEQRKVDTGGMFDDLD